MRGPRLEVYEQVNYAKSLGFRCFLSGGDYFFEKEKVLLKPDSIEKETITIKECGDMWKVTTKKSDRTQFVNHCLYLEDALNNYN